MALVTDQSAIPSVATADVIHIVDVSDTTDNAAGSSFKATFTQMVTFFSSAITALSNLVTVGALNSGSITSGFGTIDIGSSALSTTGTITGPSGTWDAGGVDIAASDSYAVAGTDILSDSAGTMTLSNIDALDATSEATVEAAIDTLANLTSVQGLAVTLADAGADAILGWDDTASAYENLTQAEVLAVVGSSSVTAQGVIEVATAAETSTGTDAARCLSPDGLAGSNYGTAVVSLIVFDDSEDTATGNGAGDLFWRVPSTLNGFDLVAVAAQVQTAGTTGTTDIQINNVTQAADMLTTVITIDSAETDSSTAAAAAVIDTANDDVATGDQIRIDVDAISTTAAKGLLIEMQFRLP